MPRSFRLVAFVVLAALGIVPACFAGPFGFEKGMTKAQIIALVGEKGVKTQGEDFIELSTAPKPHALIDTYILRISPDKGLLKVIAVSKQIETTIYGDELRSKFKEVAEAMGGTYGPSTHSLDFVRSGSIWHEPEDWMMALNKKERTLETYWQFKPAREGLTVADVEALALTRNIGFLKLTYEFDGWEEYADLVNKKKNSVF